MYTNHFLLPEAIYLLSHSVGCLPRQTLAARERYFTLWQTQGGNGWDGWLAAVESFCSSLAGLLNGRSPDFCPQSNISSGLTKILGSLPERTGKKRLLFSELDFPSVGFVVQQAHRWGYEIRRMPAVNGRFPLARWREYLTDDLQAVLITHVLYGNSFRNEVAEIIKLAREREIITIVDIAQSTGVVPIDLQQWQPDFVVGSSVKWLCGGPGAGFLWVNPDHAGRFQPLDVGWFSHENPFEFDIDDFRYAPDARRFWGGTPSVLPYLLAQASIDLIEDIGVKKIQAHNHALTGRLIEWAQSRGLPLRTPAEPNHRGGTVCIGFPDAEATVQQLHAEGVWVDFRPHFGVRFSPHIYISEADIELTVAVLEQL